MSFLKKGKKQSLRKKFLNNKKGTYMKNEFPKGEKSVSVELKDGKDNLKTIMKYSLRKMGVEEHLNQRIGYQFYSEDDDYNYTIYHSNTDDVMKNIKVSEKEYLKFMDNRWTTTIYGYIKQIKTQQLSKGKVDDDLIYCMDNLLPLYVKHIITPMLKKLFSMNPSYIHPPLSLYKNVDEGYGDIVLKLKKDGDGVRLSIEFKQFELDNPKGYWVDEVLSDSTLTKEEIEGLKSVEEENFDSELNKLLGKNGINKN